MILIRFDVLKCQSSHNVFHNQHLCYQLGKYHNLLSLVSVCTQVFAMYLIANGNIDFTSDHLADIAVLLSSCTNVISTEVPIALDEIATCIRKNGNTEKFREVEPAQAVAWLKSNCPAAAEKLQAFFDTHGHRGVQELDLFAEPWILRPDSIITTIQVQKTNSKGVARKIKPFKNILHHLAGINNVLRKQETT